MRSFISSIPLAALLAACSGGAGEAESDASASGVSVASIASITAGLSSASDGTTGGDSGSSGDSEDSGDSAGTSTSGGSASGAASSAAVDPDPKWDLGIAPDFAGGCVGVGGALDESFIWIPGTNNGTVAKIDTRTMNEVAVYNIGPSGGTESASRTAVSGDGRFVVVNSRGTGRSTAIAANIADCFDSNQDGVITTSQGPGDLVPWGQDECLRWSLVHPSWDNSHAGGPRGITWTIGDWNEATCSFVNQKVWLGYTAGGGTAHLARIDGEQGTVEEIVQVPGWQGQGNFAPYGGALDPEDRPWFTGLRGELVRVNTDNNPIDVSRFSPPGHVQSYGMTVDPYGNPWMAGCSGPVTTYDIPSGQWISVDGTSACHRGMAIDHDFRVWVASNGPCGLVEIDGATRTLTAKHTLGQCSTPIGVSVDVDGFVWLVDQSGWAWKIDPANPGAMQQMQVPGNHYVYSDMTGGQLKSVINPPG